MRRLLRGVNTVLETFGLDLRKTARASRGLPGYLRRRRDLRKQGSSERSLFPFGRMTPCLGEGSAESGFTSGHYFLQDLIVARRIREAEPTRHVDVGSRVDGFVAHVASFREIEVVDVRPMRVEVPGVRFVQADIMEPLPDSLIASCDSLSCLHALEHFGLGRYGDRVDWNGHLLGLDNLHRMLKSGGRLYLSVPIGPQRIEYDAHRVFSLSYLLEHLADRFRIQRFSFIDDAGTLHEDVPLKGADARGDFGCLYGCGIFELAKAPADGDADAEE